MAVRTVGDRYIDDYFSKLFVGQIPFFKIETRLGYEGWCLGARIRFSQHFYRVA